MDSPLENENVWVEKYLYNEAEKNYFVHLAKVSKNSFSIFLHNYPSVVSVCKLLNGCVKNDTENSQKIIQTKRENNRNPKVKIDATQELTATSSTDTKKEKEKKNKRINNKNNTMKGGTSIINEPQQPPINGTKTKDSPDDVNDDLAKAQTAPKSKKDRWRSRRKSNRKDEENGEKINGHTLNGAKTKGESNLQDEKKVNTGTNPCTLVSEIAKARQHIKNSLERMDGIAALAAASPGGDVFQRLTALEIENKGLVERTNLLQKTLNETQNRVKTLESRVQELTISKPTTTKRIKNGTASVKVEAAEEDDGVDSFASDSEEEYEAAAKYAKSKKPRTKSSLILDIKPLGNDTDLNEMEKQVRETKSNGLRWGASKFISDDLGMKILRMWCLVEEDKISIEWFKENIGNLETVQSVKVADSYSSVV